jgi:hypothetical protein
VVNLVNADRFGVAGEKVSKCKPRSSVSSTSRDLKLDWESYHATTRNYAILGFRALLSSLPRLKG